MSAAPSQPGRPGRQEKLPRASRACTCCHTRKVRCDVLQVGCPCTRCQVDGFDCGLEARKKRRSTTHTKVRALRGDGGSQEEPAEASRPQPDLTNIMSPPQRPPARPIRLLSPPQSNRIQRVPVSDSSAKTLPQHFILHQIPHYPFLIDFTSIRNDLSAEVCIPGRAVPASYQPGDASDQRDSDNRLGLAEVLFLRQKGAFDLPEKPIMDEFINSYFKYFHPFFPIIDKPAFLHAYSEMEKAQSEVGRGPSLLLLRAVLFTAASTVRIEALKAAGFTSRKQGRSILHRRTRYLYDFDYETDSIVTIQTLLLMSHHYPSMVEQKHTWHWAHQAITLAHMAGLHRDACEARQRRLWARIWWGCLMRDRLISLGTGRPMHINSLDCDTPMLTMDDLHEYGDTDEECTIKVMFVEFVKLCQYMEGVLSLQHPMTARPEPDQVQLCDDALYRWLDHLPREAQHQGQVVRTPDRPNIAFLYRAVLHLMHNTIVIALHQPHHRHIPGATSIHELPERRVKLAALDSTELVTQLVEHDLVKYCPTICVTAVLPPLIVHLLEIRAATSPSIRQLHVDRYKLCMTFLRELGDIYWHATFYHDFFELAASVDNAWTKNPISRSQDPLIAFLKQQTAIGERLGGGNSRASGSSDSAPHQASNFSDIAPTLQYGPYAGPETISEVRNKPLAPNSDARIGLKVRDSSAAEIITEPPDGDFFNILGVQELQFEEWLGECGNFLAVFPSA